MQLARARAHGTPSYRVAAAARVHPGELSRWVRGSRRPTLQQAIRVAAALGCTTEDLFPGLITNNVYPLNDSGPTVTAAGPIKTAGGTSHAELYMQ